MAASRTFPPGLNETMKTKHLAVALAAASMALSACGDSTGSSGTTASGSLSFDYTGARSGSYRASGAFQRTSDTTFAKQPFAVGARGTISGVTFVDLLSYQPVDAQTGHMVLIELPNVTAPTTFSLDGSCDTDDCPLAAVIFDTDPNASEDDSDLYFFETGTLQVTSVSSGRLRGTFSGTATEFLGDQTITVTNGTFDVPLVSQSFAGTRAVSATVKLRAMRS